MIAVILAAGSASRFGQSKLDFLLNQKPIINHVVDSLNNYSKTLSIYVVTGDHKEKIESILPVGIQGTIHNPNFASGLGTSVQAAVDLAKELKEDLLITLGDLPFVSADDYKNIVSSANDKVVFASFSNTIGPPAFIPYPILQSINDIPANKGLKAVLKDYQTVVIANAEKDIDTPQDLSIN